MTTDEKLDAIVAKCRENLALADKRTQGAWIKEINDVWLYEGDEIGARCIADCYSHHVRMSESSSDNAAYIAACAGSAEAGWRSTIAAVEGLRAAESLIYSVQNNYDDSSPKWWIEQREKVMAAQSAILAAWEGMV